MYILWDNCIVMVYLETYYILGYLHKLLYTWKHILYLDTCINYRMPENIFYTLILAYLSYSWIHIIYLDTYWILVYLSFYTNILEYWI